MMMRPSPLLAVLLAGVAAPAAAHPHVFVDATVEVLTEAGAVTGVRLVWTYDDFFSLMLTEDLGLDTDGDLILTNPEAAALEANVTDWPADYSGDLVIGSADTELPLAPREDHGAVLSEGRVIETHRRPLVSPVPATEAPVTIKVFDPYYYVAYTVTGVTVTGDPSCQASLVRVDPEAAQAEVDATWAGLDWASAAPDVELPPIGAAFSDRVEVRCGG
jgi:ABC-type uncharacterized transport system substrate-binding protein